PPISEVTSMGYYTFQGDSGSPVGRCPTCTGKGHLPHQMSGDLIECPDCEGTGRLRIVQEIPDEPVPVPPRNRPGPRFRRLAAALRRLLEAHDIFRKEMSADALLTLGEECAFARMTLDVLSRF